MVIEAVGLAGENRGANGFVLTAVGVNDGVGFSAVKGPPFPFAVITGLIVGVGLIDNISFQGLALVGAAPDPDGVVAGVRTGGKTGIFFGSVIGAGYRPEVRMGSVGVEVMVVDVQEKRAVGAFGIGEVTALTALTKGAGA